MPTLKTVKTNPSFVVCLLIPYHMFTKSIDKMKEIKSKDALQAIINNEYCENWEIIAI